MESGVEEGDVFGFRKLFKGCADEGESWGVVSVVSTTKMGNQSRPHICMLKQFW